MAKRNGFSELAKLLVSYPTQGQQEALREVLSKDYTQDLLIELLTHDFGPTRQAAAYALGVIGDTQAVPSLVETLQHEDSGMRSNAEQALWAVWFRSGDESTDEMLREGAKYIKDEQYEEAVEKLTEVIQVAPDFPEGHNQRAIAYFMLEDWEKSIDDCRAVIALNPFHFGAFAGIGHGYLRLGNLSRAIDAYQRALEINPNLYAIAHTILQIQKVLREHFGESTESTGDE